MLFITSRARVCTNHNEVPIPITLLYERNHGDPVLYVHYTLYFIRFINHKILK